MLRELSEDTATELGDKDMDDQLDSLDDELEVDDDLETWRTIRRYVPTEPEPGD